MSQTRTLLAATTALAAAFAVSPALADTPKDQLIIGMNMVNLTSLDPHNVNSYESYHFIANLYDTLVRDDLSSPGKLQPSLAKSWQVQPDGSIEFTLDDTATFQSGAPVTAEDVVYSFSRAVKLGLLGKTYFEQWGYTRDNVAEKFVAKDDHTFVMKVAKPISPTLKLGALTRAYAAILDSAEVQKHEKDGDMGRGWLASHSAGSGPFKLNRWNPNDIALLDRDDEYWGGEPKMKRVVVRHLPESQTERLLLEKGDLDVGFQLVSSDIDGLAKNPDIVIDRLKGSGFYYLIMSTEDPDFKKPEVRKAIRYCINYKDVNDVVMKNYGEAATTFVPEEVAGFIPGIGNVYDPAKCKQDLAAAGYPDGFTKQLLALSSVPYADLATAIQQNLSVAKIKTDIQTGNGDQTYGPMRNRKFQLGVGRTGSSSPGDADGWIRTHAYNPNNAQDANLSNLQAWRASFELPEVNKLLDEAAAITGDEAKRVELYKQALKIFEDSAPPVIPISRRVDPYAKSARLVNYVGDPSWMTRWNQVEKKD
ncbi:MULTISPECIES: ABC transporter substrate-binding protein [unclassified Sinorhizobium]|uniref:ABC transporter substrate-binding protein n=1 Tax=unclassified Sinorhizobium TaxID=2613772 RepID=UPI0035246157